MTGSGGDWTERQIHFIGIGGAGMSGLALATLALGSRVTGSDRDRSSYFERLERAGASLSVGHDRVNLPEGAEVVGDRSGRDGDQRRLECGRPGRGRGRRERRQFPQARPIGRRGLQPGDGPSRQLERDGFPQGGFRRVRLRLSEGSSPGR
ncbi:MAG: Mur ligase domain-containing protein [Ilumatobacteraceae bacterium]